MLVARGQSELGRARLKWGIGIGSRVWCLAVDRERLALDTRYIPGSSGSAEGRACLYLLLKGRFDHHGVGVVEGPAAFLLTLAQVEGEHNQRPSTFRSTGEPYIALELRLKEEDLCFPLVPSKRLELDQRTWDAAAAVARLDAHHDDESFAASGRELIERLADAGIVSPRVRESVAEPDAWAVRRLWQALKPMIEGLAPASSLQNVSEGTGLSLRHSARVIEDFLGLAVWGLGWRQVTLHGRFKIAILLLSAEDMTVEEVARMVGYGNMTAMARAFRMAGLDAPSFIQQRLREAAVSDPH